MVGDLEIVAITKRHLNLFDEPVGESMLDIKLQQLVREGKLLPPSKNGEKYKKFAIGGRPELHLDLFITTPPKWGYTLAIRTGPADFSRKLVTRRDQRGFMPSDVVENDCQFWRNGILLPTQEEEDVLQLCLEKWVDPWERN